MRFSRTFFVSVVLVIGLACAYSKPINKNNIKASNGKGAAGVLSGNDVKRYFPLVVGAKWRYKVERLGTKIVWVRKIVRFQNGEYIDNNGARFVADVLGVRDQSRYFLRSGVPVGFKWWAQLDYKRRQWLRFLSASETVRVPVGEYRNCVLIEATMLMPDGRKWIERTWFAKDVGMVKREVYIKHPAGKQTLTERTELVEFIIKKLDER